jgi:hypothetical protein
MVTISAGDKPNGLIIGNNAVLPPSVPAAKGLTALVTPPNGATELLPNAIPAIGDAERGFYVFDSTGQVWYSKDGINFVRSSHWGSQVANPLAAGSMGSIITVCSASIRCLSTGPAWDQRSSTSYPEYVFNALQHKVLDMAMCRAPDYAGDIVVNWSNSAQVGAGSLSRRQTCLPIILARSDTSATIPTFLPQPVGGTIANLFLTTDLVKFVPDYRTAHVKLFYNPWSLSFYAIDNTDGSTITKFPVISGPGYATVDRNIGVAGPYISMAIDSATTFAVLRRSTAAGVSRYTYDGGATWQPTSGIAYGGPVATGLVNGKPLHVTMRSSRVVLPTRNTGFVETYTATSCNSWTARPRASTLAMDCADIRWGDVNNNDVNGRFVAIGNDGDVGRLLYSNDGVTWAKCSIKLTPGASDIPAASIDSALTGITFSAMCYL